MKFMSQLAAKSLPAREEKGQIVDFIAVGGDWEKLESPLLSTELACRICGGSEHYAVFCNPAQDARRVWVCAKGDCVTNTSRFNQGATHTPTPLRCAVVWPLFCEINAIGDKYHALKFEKSLNYHSEAKISFMLKWLKKPEEILLMQGTTGNGKTQCALGMCEMFTRTNHSCIFMTHRQMLTAWLDSNKGDAMNNFQSRVTNANLLVVDDFGTAEPTPGFMTFFMDLLNTRMQWTDRGTVVTTNLTNEKLNLFCGDALYDRLTTGQKFLFEKPSLRKPLII